MASVYLKIHPFKNLVHENRSAMLCFWGYLWDDGKIERLTGNSFKTVEENTGQFLLDLYMQYGLNFINDLNGRFSIALLDKTDKKLHLITDRYGFSNLYYWHSHDEMMFASEYKSMTWYEKISKEVDKKGLSDFMSLGYCTRDRTFFKSIKLVPQACILTYAGSGRPVPYRYWDYTFYSEADPLYIEEDYIDQFYQKLKTATERQLKYTDNLLIPLSSGYDSRALSGMIEKAEYPNRVNTISYGKDNSFDVVYGRKIAKKLKFPHVHIPIETDYLEKYSQRFVWLTEGSVNCMNAHMLLLYPLILEKGYTSVLTGFFGDIICGSAAWIYSVGIHGSNDDESIFQQQYQVHANIMNDREMKCYLKDELYSKLGGETFNSLKSRYFECPSNSRYFRSRYFSIHERQRRYTSFNLYLFDFVTRVIAPFIDREFVEWVCHIPPSLAVYQNCYRKMINKHLSRVASVPHNETGLPLNASWLRKGLQWRLERFNRHSLLNKTIGRKYARMNDNYINSADAIRTGSREFVFRHIKNDPFLSEFFNMDEIRRMLADHLSGRSNEYGKITALLTLSLWHKQFIENRAKESSEILNASYQTQ